MAATTAAAAVTRSALVIGGAGALGRAVVDAFRTAGWRAVTVDVSPNADADAHVDSGGARGELGALRTALTPHAPFHAVVCAAGGWVGGRAGDDGACDAGARMWEACVRPAAAAAHLAARLLATNSAAGAPAQPTLLVLTGAAAAAAGATPTMAAYGAAKAATHHLAASVAAPDGGLPAGCRVVALLPRVLDTPSNRQWMGGPGVDTDAWTPPRDVAARVVAWARGADADVVRTGACAFVEPVTSAGVTRFDAWRGLPALTQGTPTRLQ